MTPALTPINSKTMPSILFHTPCFFNYIITRAEKNMKKLAQHLNILYSAKLSSNFVGNYLWHFA
ncbi:hypothetical protein DCCM_4684 [Desulfocucumis palustris]|uniref:Uncharacterized protein n=1 Tax=Desulfocucumis palustris TaxID=1898651 RepID=A0A2L2XH70_9FIRM|nr:hypothetical protein DCCM_4684 [Desulfocucumis palustris]